MRAYTVIAALLSTTAAAKSIARPPQQHIFANPSDDDHTFTFPTVRESVAMARKIMHLTTIGNLVTVFPQESSHSSASSEDDDAAPSIAENRPADVAGSPIGLMEYYADCDPSSGNPVLLGINIATPFRNYAAGSNISLSIRWWPERRNTFFSSFFFGDDGGDGDDEIPTPHTPAALPRFSLHGYLAPLPEEKRERVQACFLRSHPDSALWQPGNDIHTSDYVQLVVEHVYWFGGFGDRARIQWLPIDEWRNISMEEVIKAKLPGERKRKSGWRDWL